MDKILVSVYALAIDEEYDMFVPINEKVVKYYCFDSKYD